MQVPQEQKQKLIAAVEAMPADKKTISEWVTALRQDDVPKDTVFDILVGIKAAMETKDQVQEDPKLNEIINQIDSNLKAGTDIVEQDIASAENRISQIDKDLTELKNEVDGSRTGAQQSQKAAPEPPASIPAPAPEPPVQDVSHQKSDPSAAARDDAGLSQSNPPVQSYASPPANNPAPTGGEYYT